MKLKTLTLSIALAAAVTAPLAATAQPSARAAHMPQTPEQWAATMWDFTRNPMMLKDPKTFVPWFSAALEPGFYTGLGMQSLDPAMWAFMMNTMMNPDAFSAWAPLMTDPNV